LAFFSRKLSGAQTCYSTFDSELLAVFLALRQFRFFLEGWSFKLLTDHKLLLAALHRVSPPWSARQQRQLSYISEFDVEMQQVAGADNEVADCLSRPAAVEAVQHVLAGMPTSGVNYAALAQAQLSCPDGAELRARSSLQLVSVPVARGLLIGDMSTGVLRPLVPDQYRRAVFNSVHEVAHAGIRALVRLVSARFVWPGIAKQVAGWARECVACQRAKVVRHVHLGPERIPMPARRFAHVHVDIVGPLPVSQGFSHMLTMIDRSTRWPEVVPLSSTSTCVHVLLHAWVSRFGMPAVLTSDRGPQFTSALWAGMCEALGITHSQTTAYHPEVNGMVERLHRRLKDALLAREAGARWLEHLPWILLGLRAAEAVFGSSLMLPGQYLASEDPPPEFYEKLVKSVAAFEPAPDLHNTTADSLPPEELPEALMAAPMVFVRRDGILL
jgi:Integrase core domain/Integrase zinc binding domain/RNase H-like domain found in reverse transcriptase